jgi:hypothetical protein
MDVVNIATASWGWMWYAQGLDRRKGSQLSTLASEERHHIVTGFYSEHGLICHLFKVLVLVIHDNMIIGTNHIV